MLPLIRDEFLMKNIFSVFALVSLLAVGGCSSSPWEYMPANEARAWRGIGVTAQEAHRYRRQGFTPVDVKPWMQAGISSSATVVSWHQMGFSPLEASKWIKKGFTVQQAVEYRQKGLTVGY